MNGQRTRKLAAVREDCCFTVRIAEQVVRIRCYYRDTMELCRGYLVQDAEPDFGIAYPLEEIAAEWRRSVGRALPKRGDLGDKVAVMYDEGSYEPVVVCRRLAQAMAERGTILLHGAAIAWRGRCFIFTAPSGTGKTTHILNWRKAFPETVIVNGDKPLIHVDSGLVYGTPWCGKEGYGANMAAPLAGIVALERGAENVIRPAPFEELLPLLLRQVYIPGDVMAAARVWQLIRRLRSVPCWRLWCNQDEASAVTACRGLNPEELRGHGEE